MLFPLKQIVPCQASQWGNDDYRIERDVGGSWERLFTHFYPFCCSHSMVTWLETTGGRQMHWCFFGPSINQSLNLRVDREHKRSEDQSARSVLVTSEKDNFRLIDGAIGSEMCIPQENKQTGSQITRLYSIIPPIPSSEYLNSGY